MPNTEQSAPRRIFWQDHVAEFDDRYREYENGDGTITHEVIEGEILQEGTPQDDTNFNCMDERIFSARETATEAVRLLLIHGRKLNALLSEEGETDLTNTQEYPFNNSVITVPLVALMDTTDYTVEAEVLSSSGDVGRIIISDKQQNGFKMAYTGSATSAKIKYAIKGGLF